MRCSRFSIAVLSPLIALCFVGSAAAAPTDFDTDFSGDGKMVDSALFSEQAIWSSAIQSDGKIVTVGSDNGSQRWLIMRFNADGTLDDTFDGPPTETTYPGNGKVQLNPSSSFDAAYDVSIVPSTQRIVVAGRVRNTSTNKTEFGVVRLEADDGDIDPGFNSGAVKAFEIDDGAAGNDAYLEAVTLDGAKIVVGGYANDGAGNNTDFAVARLENDGDLDPTLDGDGTGLKSMTGSGVVDYLSDIRVDSSSNILMFGTTADPSNFSRRVFVASRFTSTGAPDTTFGNPLTPAKSYALDQVGFSARVERRSTGEFMLVGNTNAAPDDCMIVQFTAEGLIDTSFSTDGYQTVDFKSGLDTCSGIDEDAAGRVLISGMSRDANFNGDAVIARLTANGDLDTDFDPDGKVLHKLTTGNDNYVTIHANADGTILAGGFQGSNGSTADAAVLNRLDGGSGGFSAPVKPSPLALDTTFDGDGLVRSDLSSGRIDQVNGLSVSSDGSSVVAGTSEFLYSNSPLTYLPEATLAKYLPNGAPDTSFGGDGVVKLDLPGFETAEFFDAEELGDGSVIAVGNYSESGSGVDLLIAKFTASGDLDTSFDTDLADDGWVLQDFNYADIPTALHVNGDGSITVTGSTGISSDLSMFSAKFDANGVLDGSYGTSGITEVEFDPFGAEQTLDSALMPDGSVVLAGFLESSGEQEAAVAMIDELGDPDPSFDTDGKNSYSIGTGDSRANGVALQADGKIVIAGVGFDGALTQDAFAARITADGVLDADDGPTPGFSSDGLDFVPFSTEDDSASGVVVDSVDGQITIAGSVNYGLEDDFAFARFDSNGELVAAFDDDGIGSTPVGTGFDNVTRLAIDSSRRVLAAGTVNDTGLSDTGLARLPGPVIPGDAPPESPPPGGGGTSQVAGTSKITSPKHNRKYAAKKLKVLKGSANSVNVSDPVSKVEIALRRIDSKRCYWLSSSKAKFRRTKMKSKKCPTLRWMKVSGKSAWSLKLRKSLPKGSYELHSRVTLASGTAETSFKTKTNKIRFKLR